MSGRYSSSRRRQAASSGEVRSLSSRLADVSALVGVLESQRHLARVVAGVRHRQWTLLFQHLGQALAGHELHHQHVQFAGLFGVVGRDDVGVG